MEPVTILFLLIVALVCLVLLPYIIGIAMAILPVLLVIWLIGQIFG